MYRFVTTLGVMIFLSTLFFGYQNCQQNAFKSNKDQDFFPGPPEGYVQLGDMYLPQHLVKSNTDDDTVDSPVMEGVSAKWVTLWPEGKLYYEFHPNVTAEERKRFREACVNVSAFAGVKCVNAGNVAPPPPYVVKVMTLDPGWRYCGSSAVGMNTGRGGQYLYMNRKCWMVPPIVEHEIMHAFGLAHEQHRPDRNDYIDVYDAETGYSSNNISDILNVPLRLMTQTYDYESIMHYNSYLNGIKVFWKKGFDLSHPDGEILYQNYMSIRDHRSLYNLYKDSPFPKTNPTWSQYSAYRNSKPVTFQIRCKSAPMERRVCFEATGGNLSFEVINSNSACRSNTNIGQSGRTVWIEKGCEAKLKITTNSVFTNVFQINGYEKYTQAKVIKTYRDWELENGK